MIINSAKTDPNKILPIRYPWARQYYKAAIANNWTPEEVSMQKDVEQWKSTRVLSDAERRLVLYNLGFFSTAESLTANNIVLAVYQHVTSPEARQYLLRQAFEEAIHTDTFIYGCDSLSLDPDEVYNMYIRIPSIAAKDEFVVELTRTVFEPGFVTTGIANIQRFLRDLVGFYVIMEGIFFYAGFAMMLALRRQNKMVGLGEQFEYIMRDESLHLAFGCDLIATIGQENPGVWTAEFKARDREPDRARRRPRTGLRARGLPGRRARPQRGAVRRVRRVRRRSPARAARPAQALPARQPVPVDVAGDRPLEGEELLRDAGHRVPDRRVSGVGLASPSASAT